MSAWKGALPYRLWDAIDAYVEECGGDPGKFTDGVLPSAPDVAVTDRLRDELRKWCLETLAEALKGER